MKRSHILCFLPGLMLLLALAAAQPGLAQATLQAGVVTGGIGMSRADWEAAHGPGVSGQNYVTYENGAYYVQFRGDVVSYLEFGWGDPGVTVAQAEAIVLGLMPSDARLTEVFSAPPTDVGPIGLSFRRYASPALAATVPPLGGVATGGILVVYSETAAAGRFEPNVSRVSIAIGSAP